MQIEEQLESMDSLVCPSFSTYSTINDIADQVTREDHCSEAQNDNNDFEFVAFRKEAEDWSFVDGGHAARVFPIFNRENLAAIAGGEIPSAEEDTAAIRASFGNLMVEDRGPDRSPSSSSSSSEEEVEDEPEAVPEAGSFCLWITPKSPQASPMRCKKSNSTGSTTTKPSKRWKLLSFLRRSNSEGKRPLMLLAPPSPSNSVKKGVKSEGSPARTAGKKTPAAGNGGAKKAPAAALEGLYVRKGEIIRRKSYLPYRQDLGFGVGLNAIGKGFPLQ